MVVTITITKGKDAGRVVRLEEGETKTLGRGSQANIILSDVVVSRAHCRLRVAGGACYVQDLGSRNGTSVNGRPVKEEVRLADDDALGIGTELAEVRITPDTRPDAQEVEPVVPVEVVERPASWQEAESTHEEQDLQLQGEDERLLGTVVGGCRIEGLIGRDEISSVYRSTQISMERPVSLKILSPAMSGDPRSKERFIGAARTGGKLNHPNIVRVYDAGEENGLSFVAMEFVAGKSVRRLLDERERNRPLPLAQAVEIGEQIAGALDYAHSVSVVHGHITAETILVTPHGVAKLAELGFVNTTAVGSTRLPLNPARRADELQFTPPEYLTGPRSPTPQCDIYSLAAVLFFMVTGQMPFRAANEKELLERIRKGAHEPVRRLRREAPAGLARAIEVGMAAQAAQRFNRAADLLAALQQARKALS
jgi:serine/threonine-protein kinase